MKKLISLLFIIGFTHSVYAQNNFVSNQVIVMINGQYEVESIVNNFNANSHLKVEIKRTLSARAHIYLLEFDSSTTTVNTLIRQLKSDERIALVQPNHTHVKLRSTIPNDLEYPVQWSLGSSSPARIYAPEAWDISTDGITATGDTIVLAIVDGGVDIQHIDLNMFKNKHEIPSNGIDDDNNGYVDDYDGWNAYSQSGVITSDDHGTHVAGITGAKTNNSEGIAGIVWGAKLMPINASSGLESVVIEGYGYALEMRSKYNETDGDSGAFVVATNSSFGVDFGQPANFPIWCAFYDSLGAAGILNMAATTNGSQDVDAVGDIPTTCPSNFMISVSNINQGGSILGGYGATQIDLAAPGTNIRSTIPNQNYGNKTGTSMATPHVTGVIGAMYSAMCSYDMNEVHNHPDSMALVVGNKLLQSVDTVSNLQGKNNTSGRLNLFKALQIITNNGCDFYYLNVTDDPCGQCDGQVFVQIAGNKGPYSISFSNATNPIGDSIFTGLCAGEYYVTITDNDGVTTFDTTEVTGNDSLKGNHSVTPASNPSTGDGSILLNVTGGESPYSYLWNTGDTSSNLQNIGQGNYTVTISDKNECTTTETYYLYTVDIKKTNDQNELKIFPNPSTGNFNIVASDVNKPMDVFIYDTVGKLVFTKYFTKGTAVLQTNLMPGVYFIKVNEGKSHILMVN